MTCDLFITDLFALNVCMYIRNVFIGQERTANKLTTFSFFCIVDRWRR